MPVFRFALIEGTDAFYLVQTAGRTIGQVRKVYTGRSSYSWIVHPLDNESIYTKTRLMHDTRKAAATALWAYVEDSRKLSGITG